MFWVACTAIILAGVVHRHQFFPSLLAVVAFYVLAVDVGCFAYSFITGQRVIFVFFPRADRRLLTREELWATADGWPIRIGLSSPLPGERDHVDFQSVANRTIDGKTMLCDVSHGPPQPLDFMDRGPLLINHERYGICLAKPMVAA